MNNNSDEWLNEVRKEWSKLRDPNMPERIEDILYETDILDFLIMDGLPPVAAAHALFDYAGQETDDI